MPSKETSEPGQAASTAAPRATGDAPEIAERAEKTAPGDTEQYGARPDSPPAGSAQPSRPPEQARRRSSVPSTSSADSGTQTDSTATSSLLEAKRRSWLRRGLLASGVVVLLGSVCAVGAVLFLLWEDLADGRRTATALESRLTALEQELRLVDARSVGDIDLQKLSIRMERLAADQGAMAFRGELDALEEILRRQLRGVEDRLDSLVLTPAGDGEALAIARQFADFARTTSADRDRLQAGLGALATARVVESIAAQVERGEPYLEQFGLLQELVDESPEALSARAALAPFAASGTLTLSDLIQAFSIAEPEVQKALRVTPATGFDRLLQRIAGLVEIRRTRMPEGDSAEAVLAKAAFVLGAGDFQTAWELTATLPAEAQALLAEWRDEAQASMASHAAVRELERYADQRILDFVRGIESEADSGAR